MAVQHRERPCGPTDKASDYGSEDSRFKSWQGRFFYFLLGIIYIPSFFCQTRQLSPSTDITIGTTIPQPTPTGQPLYSGDGEQSGRTFTIS